ncbi:MAG: ATP-binding protein [Nitrospirae bacterium]|nr:ATP-binding protein [Nitrospirota bacterium]
MLYKFIESFYNKPFASDLLVYPCLYEEGAFFLADGALGQMWEIGGINADGKSIEELQRVSGAFSNFIKTLPEDAPVQLIFIPFPGVEDLGTYLNGDLGDPYVADYMQRKIWWHDQCKHKGFAQEGYKLFAPRTIKIFLTIKQNPLGLKGLRLHDEMSFAKTLAKLKSTEVFIETALSSGSFKFRKVASPDELIGILYRVLNPARSIDTPPPLYRGGDMRQYLFYNSIRLVDDGAVTEGIKYTVISMANAPAVPKEDDGGNQEQKKINFYTFPNILFRDVDGVSLLDYAPSMVFTVNFHIPSQESLKKTFNAKKALSFLHRFNLIGDVAIDKEIARYDTTQVLKSMYEGNRILKASFHLCVPTAPDKADAVVSQLISFLNVSSACNAFREDLIGSGILARCLPFGFDQNVPNEERFVRRSVAVSASNLADIAPIYSAGRGVRTDTAVGYYNRNGESTWLDLYDKNTSITSPHCLITGATGAGKSVTTVDFISQVLRQPSTVVVIDKGRSYRRLCLLKKGQYLSFEGETDYILNPFAGDWSDDHRAFLTSLISVMATGGTESISREEVSAISEAVFRLRDMEPGRLQGIVDILKKNSDPVSTSVARKLYPFYGNGQYARILEGDKPSLRLSNQLTVFELGDIDIYTDYQAVVVFLLIYYITGYMRKVPGRKYLIIDEAWSLFRNKVAVDFLVKAVKTFRKLGCAIVFVTQQLDDFMVIAEAMNMKDNCPNKILLYQEADVVTKNAEQLELSRGDLELYKTIRKSKKYAEAMLKTQQWTSVGRVTLDPRSYWIATTSEPDNRYLEGLLAQQMTLEEAVAHAADKYPYGCSTN